MKKASGAKLSMKEWVERGEVGLGWWVVREDQGRGQIK